MSGYNFRLRFNVPSRLGIDCDDDTIEVEASAGSRTYIKSCEKGKAIRQARKLSLIGGPYATPEEAEAAGQKWRTTLELTFSYMIFAADFGDRAYKGFLTDEGLKLAEVQEGRRVLNDVHGLMVYEPEPKPLFGRLDLNVVVGKQVTELVDVLKHAHSSGVGQTKEERLAFDLFSASFFHPTVDARFLTLMIAVETLAVRQKRSVESVAVVEGLIKFVKASNLEGAGEADSLVSALRDLRLQSITSACAELVSPLKMMRYCDLTPADFTKRCYRLRSRLVHGSSERPSREELDDVVVGLEMIMAHILSYKLGRPLKVAGRAASLASE